MGNGTRQRALDWYLSRRLRVFCTRLRSADSSRTTSPTISANWNSGIVPVRDLASYVGKGSTNFVVRFSTIFPDQTSTTLADRILVFINYLPPPFKPTRVRRLLPHGFRHLEQPNLHRFRPPGYRHVPNWWCRPVRPVRLQRYRIKCLKRP